MRIFYDNIIFSLQKAGGISVYWAELARRLSRVDSTATFYESENSNLFSRELSIRRQRESRLPIQLLRCAPFLKRLPHGALFHSSYYRVSLQRSVKNVVTAHDFTAEHFVSRRRRGVHILQKRFALLNADGVICVSQNTKNDLLALYPAVAKVPVAVIHHGVSETFQPLQAGAELKGPFQALRDRKFVVFVGARDSYKNFDLAVATLARVKECHLALVGGGALSHEETDLLNRTLPGRYHHFLGVSEAELNALYNNAHCLLYPSSYEGFGLPILEAMRAGCPVVALRASSIPEVAGEAGLLADAPDPAEFSANIMSLDDPRVRSEQVESGLRRASQFHWDRCFEQTYRFYTALASRA